MESSAILHGAQLPDEADIKVVSFFACGNVILQARSSPWQVHDELPTAGDEKTWEVAALFHTRVY